MSRSIEAHDPSAPSGHLPFAVSAKGRKDQFAAYAFTLRFSMVS